MKWTIPEISWHNREPVLSVDFQYCNGEIQRMATGGTDAHVFMWYVTIANNGLVKLEFASDLRRHNKAVNIVRFSPSGCLLASGDDEAAVWLWKRVDKDPADIFNEDDDKDNKEYWTAIKALRGHIEDVYDLSWSADSNFLISGSVDNTAIMWDVNKGRNMRTLSDHKGFVQGVAWDPLNHYVATLCSDRACRIYNITSRRLLYKVVKSIIPTADNTTNSEVVPKPIRLFHDDTLKSFCRRLTFSPDGELLIAPTGCLEMENGKNLNATYIFSRNALNKPALYLPTKDKYSVAVRCCPVLFELRPGKKNSVSSMTDSKPWETNPSVFKLPYRIVFAVATQDSVLFYDTQQLMPFAQVSKVHYTRISDITWSKNGNILAVSSTDGYCSFVTFGENELGFPYRLTVTDKNDPPSIKTEQSMPTPSPTATAKLNILSTSIKIDKSTPSTPLTAAAQLKNAQSPNSGAAASAKQLLTPREFTDSQASVLEKINVSNQSVLKSHESPQSAQSQKKKRVQLVTLFSPKLKKNIQEDNKIVNDASLTQTASPRNLEAPKSKAKLVYPEDSIMEVDAVSDTNNSLMPNDALLSSNPDSINLVLELSDDEDIEKKDDQVSVLHKIHNELESTAASSLVKECNENVAAVPLSTLPQNLSQHITSPSLHEAENAELQIKNLQIEHNKEVLSTTPVTCSALGSNTKMTSPARRVPRRIQPIMLSSKKSNPQPENN